MPVVVDIVDAPGEAPFEQVFTYLREVDECFSTYKEGSEVSRINHGELAPAAYSQGMQEVLALCEETKNLTGGYFDIRRPDGSLDPSGLVKGWAIQHTALLLDSLGCRNFYIDVGGDIQVRGKNAASHEWSVGIRNPLAPSEIVKVIYPKGKGVATSGTYLRGDHIYDPHAGQAATHGLVSLTVIGPNVYEADRFATAAFAMGLRGVDFIDGLDGFEAYAIGADGIATLTGGFEHYTYA